MKRAAETFAKVKPATFIWCMGVTQHSVGTGQCPRDLQPASRHRQCRRHGQRCQHLPRPLQRAGRDRFRPRYLESALLLRPRRRRLAPLGPRLGRALRLLRPPASTRFPAKGGRPARTAKANMETSGHTSTRWFDAANLPAEQVDQKDNLKAMFVMGHGGNTIPRMPDAVKGLETLELLVVADPHPDQLRLARRAQERHLPAADRHAVRMLGLAHLLEPLGAMGREGRRSDLRGRERLFPSSTSWRRNSASPRRCTRTSR